MAFFKRVGIVVTKGTNQMNRLQKNPDFTIEVPMDTVTYLVENGKDEVELITDDNIVDIKNTLTSYTENLKIVQGFLPIIKNAAETDSLKIVEHDSLPVMQTLDDKSMKKLVKYVEENTNIIIRQREFSIMRSIGMTQGMLRKMLIYEGIIYVGGVLGLLLIIGSIVMGIVVYILKQNIEYFVFQYPFEGLLCIICIMSFLCVIIPNIFLHKMERNSLIERIKKER